MGLSRLPISARPIFLRPGRPTRRSSRAAQSPSRIAAGGHRSRGPKAATNFMRATMTTWPLPSLSYAVRSPGTRPIPRAERSARGAEGRRWRLLDGRPAGGGEHRRGAFPAVVHWHVQVAGLGRADVVHVQRPQAERLLWRAGYRRWNRVAEGEQEDGLGVAVQLENLASRPEVFADGLGGRAGQPLPVSEAVEAAGHERPADRLDDCGERLVIRGAFERAPGCAAERRRGGTLAFRCPACHLAPPRGSAGSGAPMICQRSTTCLLY